MEIDKDIIQLIKKRLEIKAIEITSDVDRFRIDWIVKTVLSVWVTIEEIISLLFLSKCLLYGWFRDSL